MRIVRQVCPVVGVLMLAAPLLVALACGDPLPAPDAPAPVAVPDREVEVLGRVVERASAPVGAVPTMQGPCPGRGSVTFIGEPYPGQQVLLRACPPTDEHEHGVSHLEVVDLRADQPHARTALTLAGQGKVTALAVDGEQVTLELLTDADGAPGEAVLHALTARVGTRGWVVEQPGPTHRALRGPAVHLVVDDDAPWTWAELDSCTGRLSAPTDQGWMSVYLTIADAGAAQLDHQRRTFGAVAVAELPSGATAGVRVHRASFDPVGQLIHREDLLLMDEEDRLRWLVAIGDDPGTVLDDVTAGLRLTPVPDRGIDDVGCQLPSYLG